ncbi:L,D-transpeptidase family protein [Photobacterium sp. CCB-ST2H9]|uniref:L,D-transpeptidase family protein n=1 Tax=Photobacterium sp. CCB-ST2H9 TaxID=2912855 RepID=UPI00200383AF|nr:L,D-transpeptidase family protein [Photobacterium sp. CCB-ST2H9]UTM58751.1 L,D-transpeptidase family protein [Photobacterium sp. CCB-ST2H9]
MGGLKSYRVTHKPVFQGEWLTEVLKLGSAGVLTVSLMISPMVVAEEGGSQLLPASGAMVSATLTVPKLGRQGLDSVPLTSTRVICPSQSDQLCFPEQLQKFYASQDFMPAWQDTAVVDEFMQQLMVLAETQRVPGLPLRINELNQLRDKRDQRGFDLLATDTLFVYQAMIHQIQRDPSTLYRPADLTLSMKELQDASSVSGPVTLSSIKRLRPVDSNFSSLVSQINQLEQLAPHGVYLTGRPAVQYGAPIPRGEKLIKMLNVFGDLSDQDYSNLISAEAGSVAIREAAVVNTGVVHAAIRHFQQRHGLNDDGVIGPETARNMARSYQQVAQLLALNMQRNRVIRRDNHGEILQVNIPEFMLRILDDNDVLFESKVIVGRSERPTYLFSSAINHMVVNPTWNVPETIKEEDVIPKLKQSLNYLANHNMRIVSRRNASESIDPSQIDWSTVSAKSFPYEFQQGAGPNNALGQVKFMMPNSYSIYLHDTPSKRLFNKSKRNFSSGCVRVERAHDLAHFLLERQHSGQSASYEKLLKKRTTATINLRKTLAVDFIYRTAWLDEKGQLQIRDDIYGYDDDTSVPAEHDYIAMSRFR